MFGLSKKTNPPETNLENYVWVPHIEAVLSWFLENDFQVQQILRPTIVTLFEAGYRPEIEITNNPEVLKDQSDGEVSTKYAHQWLLVRVWMDLINIKKAIDKDGNLESRFEHIIGILNQYGSQTLIKAGEIVHKYNLDPFVKDLDKELNKIPTEEEKETFKQNFLADTLNATEIRILAWVYKELFKKDYKL